MKKIFLLPTLFVSIGCFAQFSVGDTLTLGVGSAQSGNFRFVENISLGTKLSNAFGAPVLVSRKYKESKDALHKSYAGKQIIIINVSKTEMIAKMDEKRLRIATKAAVASKELQ